VADRIDRSELGRAARGEFSGRLEEAGWRLLEPGLGHRFRLAEFESGLDPEFTAVTLIDCQTRGPDVRPLDVIRVATGVAFEPLRRVGPQLAAGLRPAVAHVLRSALVAYDLIRDLNQNGEIRREDDESTEDEEDWHRRIASAADATAIAEQLVDLILERGIVCARRLADVDVLLGDLEEEPGSLDWRVPALLAAAGRFEEATEAVSTFEELETSGRVTPYTSRLRRLIDSRGQSR
jgi:hypothetical protein